jgi:hypothetical protein
MRKRRILHGCGVFWFLETSERRPEEGKTEKLVGNNQKTGRNTGCRKQNNRKKPLKKQKKMVSYKSKNVMAMLRSRIAAAGQASA